MSRLLSPLTKNYFSKLMSILTHPILKIAQTCEQNEGLGKMEQQAAVLKELCIKRQNIASFNKQSIVEIKRSKHDILCAKKNNSSETAGEETKVDVNEILLTESVESKDEESSEKASTDADVHMHFKWRMQVKCGGINVEVDANLVHCTDQLSNDFDNQKRIGGELVTLSDLYSVSTSDYSSHTVLFVRESELGELRNLHELQKMAVCVVILETLPELSAKSLIAYTSEGIECLPQLCVSISNFK